MQAILANPALDLNASLLYNPLNWDFVNNTRFPADFDWLAVPVPKVINGRADAFSLECVPFSQFGGVCGG